MYCPECGKPEQTPDSYCRNCGEWLSVPAKKNNFSLVARSPIESVRISLLLSVFSGIAAFASAIGLYATFLGRQGTPLVVYMVAAFCLCIGIWQVTNVYAGLRIRKRFAGSSAKVESRQPAEVAGASENRGELSSADTQELASPLSITEENTKMLVELPRK